MKRAWLLLAALLVGVVSATSASELVKRQAQQIDIEFRSGTNNEVILVCNGREVVYLSGNNARMIEVLPGQRVVRDREALCVTINDQDGMEVESIKPIYRWTAKQCNPPSPVEIIGPGKIYVSDGQAFYLNDGCDEQIRQIMQAMDNAPDPIVQFNVERDVDGGDTIVRVDVNGNGDMIDIIATGAPTFTIGPGGTVSYAGGGLSAPGEMFTGIREFGIAARDFDGKASFRVFNTSNAPINVRGPGQLYVGADKALFIGEFGSGSSSPTQMVNEWIFRKTVTFTNIADTDIKMVTDIDNSAVTLVSGNTATFKIPGASMATYAGMTATITTSGGQSFPFSGITRFSVYDNNEVTIDPSSFTFSGSGGGYMYVDTNENTGFFITESNPTANPIFMSMIPERERVTYSVETNSDGVRNLFRTINGTERTFVQTITGAYVENVRSSETVAYGNDRVDVQRFDGPDRVRIGQVNELITNTESNSFANFTTSASTLFRGPGTITYSRGTGFYTTDSDLGSTLGFQSRTAGIPRITFESKETGINTIDGVNYTVTTITQKIGGDEVINFEATSYTTTTAQEILYANNLVTVHRPIFVGDGRVMYNGGAEELRYTDRNGIRRTLGGISTFNRFSGGNITTTTSSITPPVVAVTVGPGKLYVSEDGMTATFSNSDIVTPEIVDLIRNGPTDFMVDAEQFTSIYTGVFNLSTDTATVTSPGGGVIWYSSVDGTRYALYIDDEGVSDRIRRYVSSRLTTTKSVPAKESGILRVIFNGRDIFSYIPIDRNREIIIGPGGSFEFVDNTIRGPFVTGGPYSGYDRITVFDGVEEKQVNSSTVVQRFQGPGFLIVPEGSDEAFYTTYRPVVNYLRRAIQILRNFLVAPRIRAGKGRITSKREIITVDFGTSVTAFEGANVTFKCNVEAARPNATVGFYRVIGDLFILLNNTMGEISIEDNALTLINVQMDDVGEYRCVASNGVPPNAVVSSNLLNVREPVAPVLRPGWFPFAIQSGEKLIFPDSPISMSTVNLQAYKRLIFPCRLDGIPKVSVNWLINDVDVTMSLDPGTFDIVEPVEGRSVLVINLATFNTTTGNPLLGANIIECNGRNNAGDATGEVRLLGEFIDCSSKVQRPDCPVTCGFGIQDYMYSCEIYRQNGMSEPIPIENVPFTVEPRVDRIYLCNTAISFCPLTEFQWNVSEWSDCSRTCDGGFRTRNVTCLEETIPIDQRYVAVNASTFSLTENGMCAMSEKAGPRPTEREECETQGCPFYQTSLVGGCSATCGDAGIRQRNVECVILLGRYKDMNNKIRLNVTVVNDTDCGDSDSRPEDYIPCNRFPCFYQWRPGAYGRCGRTSLLTGPVADEFSCKERPVTCHNIDGIQVNDSFCENAPLKKPPALAGCGNKNCFVGVWGTSQYTPCSETCGYGTRTRNLTCYSPLTLTEVPTYFCEISKTPATESLCFVRNCGNMCLRDENQVVCPILASMGLCSSPYAMANNGTRCCASCGMGMPGAD